LDVEDPTPAAGEVVVQVQAAALNHLDLWTLSGDVDIPIEFPFVLGADGAGTVQAAGDGVPESLVGQRVVINPAISCRDCESCRRGEQSQCFFFQMLGEHRSGTLAEKVVLPAANVYPIPDHLPFAEAAALGVTFITAYRMLFTKGGLRPGEWVLITGIGGGLALSVLQLARATAGRIFVTSSSQVKLERAFALGAHEGIDYLKQDVGKTVRGLTAKRGVDLVVDSAGGDTIDGSMRALRPGGRLVTAGATAGRYSKVDMRRLFALQLSLIGSTMGSDEDVRNMLRMVEGAQLTPIIDRTFTLDEGPDALGYLASGERFGKVVVSLT
jgi:NADPH:quinone reductase-like Zn-dependent oxidoreductase